MSRLALIVSVATLSAPASVLAQTFTVPTGTTDTTAKTLSGTQTGTVEAGGTLRASGGQVINWNNSSTGVVITNSGTIENTGSGRAIDTSNASTSPRTISLFNNAGAVIRTMQNDAFRINLGITSGTVLIDNAGTIQAGGTGFAGLGQALDFRGMSANGATTTIINRATGIFEALTDDAIRPGLNATISNFGIIRSFGANTSGGANGTADGIDAGGNIGVVVTNQTGGLISGARHGITADTDITVVNMEGATIIGRNGSGVGSDGGGTVTNYGTITGAYAGVGNIFNSDGVAKINGDGDGVDLDNAGTIINYGTIQGLAAGGFDSGGRANTAEGISIGGGSVTNYGTITGERGITVNKDTNVDRSGVAATVITNSGTITGTAGYAIRLENKTGTLIDNDTIINRGTIIGNGSIPEPGAQVFLENGTIDTNSGLPGGTTLNGVGYTGTGLARFIRGDGSAIQMGEGNDALSNYGTIIGNSGRAINMEGGDDALSLYTGSSITGVIDGGVGTDTINLFREAGSNTGTLRNVVNFEALNVLGGVWTLADAQAYANGVTVANGAELINNGTLTANLTVQTGGIIGGSGSTIGNASFNGGFLSPGNSIGTITFNGNLTLTAATTYILEVSPTAADRVNVTGTATLGGAAVQASYSGSTVSSARHVILNATGGVAGTFGTLTTSGLPASVVSSLSYDANNAYLNLALNFAAALGPLNTNQASVAGGITNAFNAGGIPIAFAALNAQGLTRVSGEAATGVQQTTFDTMDRFLNLVTDPFLGERAGSAPNASAASYAEEGEALGYAGRRSRGRVSDTYAALLTKAPPRVDTLKRWSVWAAGYGGTQQTDGSAGAGSAGYSNHIYGGAAGADYRISQDTMVGFAMGGAGTTFGLANGLGGGRSDVFQAGIYGRHVQGATYVSGALAYGWQDVTTDRTSVDLSQLRGRFSANALSGRLEGGYRFAVGLGGITPYAAGQFTTFFLPDYLEQVTAGVNTFALGFASKNVTASRSELGLRGDQSFVLQDGILTLRGRAAWAHNFDRSRDVSATFQTLPAAAFVVNGAAPAADTALVTAGAEYKWLNGFSLAATFEGEFSRVTDSYAGKGTLRYSW